MEYYFDKWNKKIVEENNEINNSIEEFNNLINAAKKAGLNKEQTKKFLESFGYKNGEYTEKEPEKTL